MCIFLSASQKRYWLWLRVIALSPDKKDAVSLKCTFVPVAWVHVCCEDHVPIRRKVGPKPCVGTGISNSLRGVPLSNLIISMSYIFIQPSKGRGQVHSLPWWATSPGIIMTLFKITRWGRKISSHERLWPCMLKIVTKPPPPRWAGAFLGYFNPVQFLTLAGPVTWKYTTRGQRMWASQLGGNRIKRVDIKVNI